VSGFEALAEYRIVPVVVIEDADAASGLAEALVGGGLPVAEVTFRTKAAPAAIAQMASRGDLLVGAGTVLTPAQVDQAADAGASFVVSPGLSQAVVERARERGLQVLPGVATATEIMAALELGLDVLKFFPASNVGGPPAIKALAGPFGGLKFIPTGGVSLGNLSEYLSVPAVLAVGGSWMVPAKALANRDFGAIKDLVAAAAAAARVI
jgi:2-dehydro-3-deoxyphosphogluconate aldolase/(4S)-4-hydroxy-2-oxoglutarate aldolase